MPGSTRYCFRSKEYVAIAIVDAHEAHYIALRTAILDDAAKSPMNRLRGSFDELGTIRGLELPLGGCLFEVLAQTVSIRGPAFRAKFATVFAAWNNHLQRLIDEAQATGKVAPDLPPEDVAAFLIDAYEGASIRMTVDGGSAAFDRFKPLAPGALLSKPRPRVRF